MLKRYVFYRQTFIIFVIINETEEWHYHQQDEELRLVKQQLEEAEKIIM